jgi:hypothetical protein
VKPGLTETTMRLFFEFWWIVLPALFFLSLLFVSLLEKQPVNEYRLSDTGPPTTPSPYFSIMNKQALDGGLRFCGHFIQAQRGALYRGYFAFWLSEDRKTLVRIAGGKIAGMPLKKTIVSSWSEDGVGIETADEFGGNDIGGIADRKVVVNADLIELLQVHSARREKFNKPVRSFSPDSILQDQEATDKLKVNNLISLGYATFVDHQKSIWRYTIKGAIQNYFKGYRSQKSEGLSQVKRLNKKRPGST